MMLEHHHLLAMIGKAERGPVAIEAIRKFGAVYLMAVGGAAYLVSKAIRGSRVVAFGDLGMEAIYEFDVKDMPVTVAVDARGNSIHHTAPKDVAGEDRQDPGDRRVAQGAGAAPPADGPRPQMARSVLFQRVACLRNTFPRFSIARPCRRGAGPAGRGRGPAPARRARSSRSPWRSPGPPVRRCPTRAVAGRRRAAGGPAERVRGVEVRPAARRGARGRDHRHARRDPALRLADARRRAPRRAQLPRHQRPQLRVRGRARLRPHGRLQRADPAARRRPPHQRHALRPGAARHRRPRRHGPGRACGDRARRRLLALRQQRVLRRHQPRHAPRPRRRRRRSVAAGRYPADVRRAHHRGRPRRQRRANTCSRPPPARTSGDRSLYFPAFQDVNGGIASDDDADRWVKALAKWRTGGFSLSAVYDQRTKQRADRAVQRDLRRRAEPDDRHARVARRPLRRRRRPAAT